MASRYKILPADAIISKSGAGETYVINRDGERIIPPSLRADGSVRKAIKVRPGFIPEEEQQRYVSKGQKVRQGFEQARLCPPGSQGLVDSPSVPNISNVKKNKRKTKKETKEPLFTFEEPDFGSASKSKGKDLLRQCGGDLKNRPDANEETDAVVKGIVKLNINE